MSSGNAATGGHRSVERTIEIQAPVDAVWKALTDAAELTRWFPLEASVTPGVGGTIRLRWDDVYDSEGRIELWEPGRRLRAQFPHTGSAWLVTDYHLEGRGGSTVLRVVTSGFGEGADWDVQYDGVGSGWDFELRQLRHYLERHAGRDRRVALARGRTTQPIVEVWRRLTGPDGWFGPEGLEDLRPGAPYRARTVTGHDLAGVVETWRPPRQFSGSVDAWNHAFFRVELEGADGAADVWLWLATWDVPADEVRAVEGAWQEALDRLLADVSVASPTDAPR